VPSLRETAAWLLAPATEDVPRHQAWGAATLRILVGLMWLYNVAWKRPPDFGREAGNGLYKFTSYAVSDPVFAPYSWLVEHLVLPAIVPFGWLVLLAETTLAVLLLTGSYVRLAALLGVSQSLAIGLSVAYAPHEWPWAYWLMIGAHLALLTSSAGRVLAVDAFRDDLQSGRKLALGWGGAAVLVGLISAALSLNDPTAALGSGLHSTNLSLTLGRFNVLGGLALVAVGGLLILSARGSRRLGWLAAGIAIIAGLSLHVQVGFSDPLLGGNATSAAAFFAVGLVAALTSRTGPARPTS
jgi:uncharacterized membrane protein YphA (DoxX/SURF4 family)